MLAYHFRSVRLTKVVPGSGGITCNVQLNHLTSTVTKWVQL